jgi:hypothetical protein
MCRVQAPQLTCCVRGSDWGTRRVRVRKRWCSCREQSVHGYHRLVEQLRVDAKEVEVELLQRAEVQGRRVRHERLRCVRLVDLETILVVQAQVAHIQRTRVLGVRTCVVVAIHVRYTYEGTPGVSEPGVECGGLRRTGNVTKYKGLRPRTRTEWPPARLRLSNCSPAAQAAALQHTQCGEAAAKGGKERAAAGTKRCAGIKPAVSASQTRKQSRPRS